MQRGACLPFFAYQTGDIFRSTSHQSDQLKSKRTPEIKETLTTKIYLVLSVFYFQLVRIFKKIGDFDFVFSFKFRIHLKESQMTRFQVGFIPILEIKKIRLTDQLICFSWATTSNCSFPLILCLQRKSPSEV